MHVLCNTAADESQMRLHYCTEECTPKQVVNKHIINMEPAAEHQREKNETNRRMRRPVVHIVFVVKVHM